MECEHLEREQAQLGPWLKKSEEALRVSNTLHVSLVAARAKGTARLTDLRRNAAEAERALAPTTARVAALQRECNIIDDALVVANQRIMRAGAAAAASAAVSSARAGDRDSARAALAALEHRVQEVEGEAVAQTEKSNNVATAVKAAHAAHATAVTRLAAANAELSSRAAEAQRDATAAAAIEIRVADIAAEVLIVELRAAAACAEARAAAERLVAAHKAALKAAAREAALETAAREAAVQEAAAREATCKVALEAARKARVRAPAPNPVPLATTPPPPTSTARRAELDALFEDDMQLSTAPKRRKLPVLRKGLKSVIFTAASAVSTEQGDDMLFGAAPRSWLASVSVLARHRARLACM